MIEVLVTGFPNSGTSFMAELVSKAGNLHPGSGHNLKGADSHNRYGYWEHLPVRRVSWSTLGGRLNVRKLPEEPLPRDDETAREIVRIAHQDNVQVYKDNALPIVFKSFPRDAAVVIIQRNISTIYDRYYQDLKPSEMNECYSRYQKLSWVMQSERDTIWFSYEGFMDDTHYQIWRLCHFLGVEFREELEEIWRPRKQ